MRQEQKYLFALDKCSSLLQRCFYSTHLCWKICYYTVYCQIWDKSINICLQWTNGLAYYKDVFYSNHLCCKICYYTAYCQIWDKSNNLSAMDKRSSLLQRRFVGQKCFTTIGFGCKMRLLWMIQLFSVSVQSFIIDVKKRHQKWNECFCSLGKCNKPFFAG